jgi:hypothetical protein
MTCEMPTKEDGPKRERGALKGLKEKLGNLGAVLLAVAGAAPT